MSNNAKKFLKQTKNVKIKKQESVFLEWENTEDGRDKTQFYERINHNGLVFYVNKINSNSLVTPSHPFYSILEELYKKALDEL